jgi:hypothetical protein
MSYVVVTPLAQIPPIGNPTVGNSYAQVYGPSEQFITGVIDPALAFPKLQRIRVPDERSSQSQQLLLLDYLSPPAGPYYFPTAID